MLWQYDRLESDIYVKDSSSSQELQLLRSLSWQSKLAGSNKHIYILAPLVNLSFRTITWDNDRKASATTTTTTTNILLDKEMPYYFILIIKQVSDDSYERVGIVRPFHLKRPSPPRDDDHQIVFSDETGKLLDNVELTDNWGEQDWLKGAEEKMVKLR